jgi:hypothetical protein
LPPIAGCETSMILRSFDATGAGTDLQAHRRLQSWLAPPPDLLALPDQIPRYRHPSQVPTSAQHHALHSETIELPGERLEISQSARSMADEAVLGRTIHTYMAALPSLRSLAQDGKLAAARRCINGYGLAELLAEKALVAAGDSFCAWVDANFPGARWITEVPVTGPCADSGQWYGTIDLLLELSDGSLVLVDHKSGQTLLPAHAAQIAAYCEALEAQAQTVSRTLVHLPLAGSVIQVS